ncbi:MAG: phosphomannomutase/phosphoglucomutase [Pseudomonadales bacterium]|nr:phosphomannomutase/phosphoglucomutase [Pseudomonadales bacterium]
MGLKLSPEIFRAYDIRGITTRNLTTDVVYWIGRAFAAEAQSEQQTRVAVGRDGRHSSVTLQEALVRGLTEGGVDVLDIGEVPTPVLYFATHALDTGTGIMITGSHNPPEYNGLKMMIGGVTLAEERILALRTRIEENNLSEGSGDVETVDLNDHYVDRILEDVVVAQPCKVVVDCGNGVAGNLAPRLIRELGCEVVPLYCDVDGDFPNHHPDPADPDTLEDLITVVKAEKADIGLAFDGDGDRLGVVTSSGEIIWPDKLLMLFARDIVGRNPGADIIYDVKCSRHLNNLISEYGGRPIMWRTGHSHMKAKLKETGALLAGEFSGHICFGERWFGFDDALYSAARLLEILGSEDKSADEIFGQFPITYSTPEIKIATTEKAKFEIIEKLAKTATWSDGTVTTIDGVRVDYADGWGLVRASNTSPVLTLRFEADGQSALERIRKIFQTQLTRLDPSLKIG